MASKKVLCLCLSSLFVLLVVAVHFSDAASKEDGRRGLAAISVGGYDVAKQGHRSLQASKFVFPFVFKSKFKTKFVKKVKKVKDEEEEEEEEEEDKEVKIKCDDFVCKLKCEKYCDDECDSDCGCYKAKEACGCELPECEKEEKKKKKKKKCDKGCYCRETCSVLKKCGVFVYYGCGDC